MSAVPAAEQSWQRLAARAALLAALRAHFAETDALEVDTPVLRRTAVSDPHIAPVAAVVAGEPAYLQSSPEALMKALVARHGQAIYQLGHVYRDGEAGRLHRPEFTMLEWYRPGWSMARLMREVETLVGLACTRQSIARGFPVLDYQACFETAVGIPATASPAALRQAVQAHGIDWPGSGHAAASALRDVLFSHCVQPGLGAEQPVFVAGFPASEASFARLDPKDSRRALRFELYWRGIELANGGEELTDLDAWQRRAHADRATRKQHGAQPPPMDAEWHAALAQGLPACAGVALGVDRLLLCAVDAPELSAVMPFADALSARDACEDAASSG